MVTLLPTRRFSKIPLQFSGSLKNDGAAWNARRQQSFICLQVGQLNKFCIRFKRKIWFMHDHCFRGGYNYRYSSQSWNNYFHIYHASIQTCVNIRNKTEKNCNQKLFSCNIKLCHYPIIISYYVKNTVFYDENITRLKAKLVVKFFL